MRQYSGTRLRRGILRRLRRDGRGRPSSRRRLEVSVDLFHWRKEAISAPSQGFDEARIGSGIAQYLAEFVNDGVEAVVEVNEGIAGPELLPQFFARHHLARAFEQDKEDLKWLLLQA